jgi:ketosteroid isomerase-like protein
MGATEKRNEKIVRKCFETPSAGDVEEMRTLFNERATWMVMGTGIPDDALISNFDCT